ncbi:putative membrane protein [Streptococcus mitis]|uniref:Putative membrane protein n=1 Tax=Streptococcus mitis TaxID=28037 RepID=A0A150NIE1_STRMT|nr:putative membrane protein [Streptococcus mitis]
MNLWDIFFTTQATEPPKFDLFWYLSIFTLLALTFYTAYRYREKKAYQRFFPEFTSSSVDPPLRLVLDQSYAAIRKFTFLPLPYGYVCGAFASWSV